MDIQTLIVVAIIVVALLFTGDSLRRKARSMKSSNKNCGTDCGCGPK